MGRKRAVGTERFSPIPMREDQLSGRRLIRPLEEQLQHLHSHCTHGNRTFHYDQLVVAHLLVFFNPALTSLRTIEDAFDNPRIRKRAGLPRVPKSTLADAQRLFDPALLLPLVESLKTRVGIQPHDRRLDKITQELLAVDGTFFAVAPRIAWALYNKSAREKVRKGNVRAHVHFDILRGVPVHATLTDGQADEGRQLAAALQAGRFYVMDRGFQAYQLLADIVAHESDFLVRLRKGMDAETVQQRTLSAADRLAGVRSDTLVRVRSARAARAGLPTPMRLVEITQADKDEPLQLLTNRLDLSAELIGLLYRHRWQIELFFRWLKCMANFRHFYSESPQGMTLQVYIALIGTLLIAIETGAKPSKYDYAMMTLVAGGVASLDEALLVLEKRRAERARAAAWQKAYRGAKKTSR